MAKDSARNLLGNWQSYTVGVPASTVYIYIPKQYVYINRNSFLW